MHVFNHTINHVIDDKKSGSLELLQKLQNGLQEYFAKEKETEHERIKTWIHGLMEHFSGFAVILHFLSELEKAVDTFHEPNQLNSILMECIDNYKKKWGPVHYQITENFLKHNSIDHKHVLLHSQSTVIKEFMKEIRARGIKPVVYQTLSSPMNEGVDQALYISSLGLNVNLITEAAVFRFMPEIDLSLLGADSILENTFINKTGSSFIAMAARYYKKDVFVLCDSRKKIANLNVSKTLLDKMKHEGLKDPNELLDNPGPGINVLNYYFEEIPLSLVSAVISDDTN